MDEQMLVRIKPHNLKAGYKVQSYTYAGMRFRESLGWYRVDRSLADKLVDLVQDETDPLSQPVFDVLSEEQAKRLEEQEMLRRQRASALRPNQMPVLRPNDPRRRVASAGTMTTADLRGEGSSESFRTPEQLGSLSEGAGGDDGQDDAGESLDSVEGAVDELDPDGATDFGGDEELLSEGASAEGESPASPPSGRRRKHR